MISDFLLSYMRKHRQYPTLSELKSFVKDKDLPPADEEFLRTAQEIPDDMFDNAFYHVQGVLTYRDSIETVKNLYQGLYHHDMNPHGEW